MAMLRRAIVRCFSLKGQLPEDTEALRRVIMYRCGRAGILEAELLLRDWASLNLPQMNRTQLLAFHEEVLENETPDILAYILGTKPSPESEYFEKLKTFVDLRRGKSKT